MEFLLNSSDSPIHCADRQLVIVMFYTCWTTPKTKRPSLTYSVLHESLMNPIRTAES